MSVDETELHVTVSVPQKPSAIKAVNMFVHPEVFYLSLHRQSKLFLHLLFFPYYSYSIPLLFPLFPLS